MFYSNSQSEVFIRQSDSKLLNPIFIDRWSPRSFLSEPVPAAHIKAIFEAARWSPSCFNEQPWMFVYSTDVGKDSNFIQGLAPGNQKWAFRAPLLVYVFARKVFSANGKINEWAKFDTGASWMSLNLQAEQLGYRCHGMGGIENEKVYEITKVPEDQFEVICAIVIGKQGKPESLPEDLASKENPNERKSVDEFVFNSSYKK